MMFFITGCSKEEIKNELPKEEIKEEIKTEEDSSLYDDLKSLIEENTKKISELEEKNQSLEKEIASLKTSNSALETKNKDLETKYNNLKSVSVTPPVVTSKNTITKEQLIGTWTVADSNITFTNENSDVLGNWILYKHSDYTSTIWYEYINGKLYITDDGQIYSKK